MATISTVIPGVGLSQIFQESVRMIEHGVQCCNNSFLCPVWHVINLQKRMYLQQVPLIRSRHEGLHALSRSNLHEPAREIRFPLTHRQTLLLLAEGEDRCVCACQCVTNTRHLGWLMIKSDDFSFIYSLKRVLFMPMLNWLTF